MRKSSPTLVAAIAISLVAASTVGVAAQEETSVRTDIVAGVELMTEAVEPGVLRIVSDGVRDLSIPLVVGEEEDGAYHRTSRIVAASGGRVWVFGPEAFFRLGAGASHEGRAWDSVEVDEQGTIWALADGGRLETFDGTRWDRKARRVLDFDIHPDGSVFMLWEAPGGDGSVDIIGPLRKRDWKDGWAVADRPSAGMGEGSFEVRPGFGFGGNDDSYRGWHLANGFVNSWGMSESVGGEFGPFNDHAEVQAMASGPNGPSWFLTRFDGAVTLEEGRLVASPQYLVAMGPPEDGDWFEIPGTQPVSPTFSDDIVVGPDRSLWLPSDDGLAHFDRRTWTWFLRGHSIDDIDIAPDGSAWVQAADTTSVSTYLIDPEAAMAAE